MNKLQLYIYKSVRGFKSVQNINPAENIQRHIRDNRQALKVLDYDPAEKYLFYLLTYIGEGTFLTILRTIPDKPLDHLSATIFVPNGLQITGEELAEIIGRTTRIISNSSVSAEEITELHDLFATEYPADSDAPSVVPSQGREYAFSYYGGDTGRRLEDFLGNYISQTVFLKYAGILLVDADLGVEVEATDLTDEPLYEPAILLPPESVNGFVPFLYGYAFERPFRVSLGNEVEIVWRRKGFDDIRQTVAVTAPEQQVVGESLDGSRKIITRSSFYVSSHGGKQPLEDAEIEVNGVEINGEHSFSFDELKNADVIVRAKGFRPYQAKLNLAATSQALVSLHEQKRIYCFELPVKSSELGAPIHFEIHTKRQLTDSPLEGYSLLDDIREGAGRYNHLHYTGGLPGLPVRQALIYIAAALVAGFLLGWLIMKNNSTTDDVSKNEESIQQTVVEVDPVKVEPVKVEPVQVEPIKVEPLKEEPVKTEPSKIENNDTPTAASIAYLDGNSKWSREELERQPGLSGLFDDMNNFRLERLSDYWAKRLGKSKRFEKVAFHAQEGARKKIFKPEGTYCKGEGDNTITVQSYLNRIDPAKK